MSSNQDVLAKAGKAALTNAALNLALIFITHDLRVAAQICHHFIVMHRGSVVESGPL